MSDLLKGKKVLITGLTGQVANPLALALAKESDVWGIARFSDPKKKADLEAAGITCVKVDLAEGDYSGVPDDFDYENSTMHATLDFGGPLIMLADNFMGVPGSGNVEIVLHLDSKEELDKIYDKAKEKGFKIKMELEKTFWGAWFARFGDSEGVGWQLNYQEEERT